MDEPVQVGIVFPRSGQQLNVNIPRQYAAILNTLSAGLHAKGVVCMSLGSNSRPTDVYEQKPRTL